MRKELETSPVKMVKYSPLGWGAQAGVTAALLAGLGYTGDTELFVGDYGFWRYTGKNKGQWNTEGILDGLGTQWAAHQMTYKQYPAGY
jgi:2-methylcitrate dehydratase PrpD